VNGQIAVGWLVVEDLVMVLVLVLLPALAGVLGAGRCPGTSAAAATVGDAGVTLAKVVAFLAVMLMRGARAAQAALVHRAHGLAGAVHAGCGRSGRRRRFGAAKLFDVSFALGAFFAGMMMRESEFSHRAAAESLPLRDAFAVLFFVSVGMLFDPQVVLTQPRKLLAVVAIIMLGKTWRPSSWCCFPLSAEHGADRGSPAWRRSASSPSSSPRWACPVGLLPPEGRRSCSPGHSSPSPPIRRSSRPSSRFSAGSARGPRSPGGSSSATIRWPNCPARPTCRS
jgi:hypothetical protein